MVHNKKVFCIIFSVVLITLIVLSSLSPIGATVSYNQSKLSSELIEKMNNMSEIDTEQVYVFLKRINKNIVENKLLSEYGRSIDVYENSEKFYGEIVPDLKVNNQEISRIAGTSKITEDFLTNEDIDSALVLNTKKEIIAEIQREMNEYISDKRNTYKDIIGNYTSELLTSCSIDKDVIIFDSDYAEFFIAELNKNEIIKLSNSSCVETISCFIDYEQTCSTWSTIELVEADSTIGLGSGNYASSNGQLYDGTGVTIGIIEAALGKYDPSNYNLSEACGSKRLDFVPTPGASTASINSHATNVTSIICGKKTTIGGRTYEGYAPNATVYQTAVSVQTDVLNAIDMFGDMGVNVINYSGGRDTGPGYSSYDKAVDILIGNLGITFVAASGNTDQMEYVASPSKAYNAISVGNLETKNNNNFELTSPFCMRSSSVYQRSSTLATKPDVVAPGTNIFLPNSDTTASNKGSGTSYSAPVVTGIVAQLMTNSAVYKVNSNAVKNAIICGASNSQITGTTTSYGQLKNESGAGLVNAVDSVIPTVNKYYDVITAGHENTEYETITDIYIKKGETIRIVLTYNKEEDIPLTSEYGNNLDIRLAQTAGFAIHAVSESTKDNVEIIEFRATSSGTYNLQLRMINSILSESDNSELRYWISWRIFK